MPRSRNLPDPRDDENHAAEGFVYGMAIVLAFWAAVILLAVMFT
jgi:hypothetical protein